MASFSTWRENAVTSCPAESNSSMTARPDPPVAPTTRNRIISSICLASNIVLHSALRLMAAEAKEMKPGGEAVITRLADILIIQAIRTWLERERGSHTGWLGALYDRQIGPAITL